MKCLQILTLYKTKVINPQNLIEMNKKTFIYLSLLGLTGLIAGCEKDETKVIFPAEPVAPAVVTWPNLTFNPADADDTIVFVGSPVNVGFEASGNYILEACVPGNEFKSVSRIFYGPQDSAMTTTVTKLNTLLKRKFPPGSTLPMEVRLRFQLNVDSGSKALGSSTNPLQVISEVYTVNVATY